MSKRIRPIAFWPPVILFVAACVYNFVSPEGFTAMINAANNWLIGNLAWAFSLGVLAMLAVIIWLMISKFGNVRIGGRDAAPMLDNFRYFSITLTSIIAIGLLLWGTAEPLYHYTAPPESLGLEPGAPETVVFSVATMFTHWGFLPLAIYAVPSIMFAFAFYNMRKPYSIASTLTPVFGDRLLGKWGQGLDAIVMYSLIAGMSASLASGILTISGGVNYLTGFQTGLFMWAVVDIVVVAAFVISSITGLFNGIRRLSEINTLFFVFLIGFILIFGPTFFMLNLGTEALANHLATFFPKAMFTGAAADDPWAGWWTMFYWCNWLSWAPISGMFLGRISYGHTVRKALTVQFVLPAVFNIVWIGFFSTAAIKLDKDTGGALAAKLAEGPEFVVYEFLSHYPLALLLIPIFLLVVFLSYVTGSDAYTTTLGGISSTGISPSSPEPRRLMKIFWGVLIGLVAWIMLASAGIDGVKILSNLGGLPALILQLIMVVALIKVANNPSKYDTRKQDYDPDGVPLKSVTRPATMSEAELMAQYADDKAVDEVGDKVAEEV
ncbi:MAG: BCCT family transporter [Propionicimonas sp.]